MAEGSRVLITSRDIHPVMEERMRNLGYEVDWKAGLNYEQLYELIAAYVGIIISSATVLDQKMIDKGKRLKFIARAGSGMEIIDVEHAGRNGIVCMNSPEGNCDAVAEHAMAMVLCLFNKLITIDSEIQNGIWKREENRGESLEGKTIGIIGYGHTGSAFAKRLSSFKIRILAYDKYKSAFANEYVEEVAMDRIFNSADIVSFHIPLTGETFHMACTEWFNKFRKPIYLINTSRGKNVNTMDLLNALKNGRVKGACLDVLENEKPGSWNKDEKNMYYRIFSMSNVIVTPHIAGWTYLSRLRLATVLADKIAALHR